MSDQKMKECEPEIEYQLGEIQEAIHRAAVLKTEAVKIDCIRVKLDHIKKRTNKE